MKAWTISVLVLSLLLGLEIDADAHSTRGRRSVILKKSTITVDDVAYYVEAYVFTEKYKDQYERSANRFGVADFLNIKQKDGIARVSFKVLDWITKEKFDDYVLFKKQPDQSWSHIDDESNVISSQITTWVKKRTVFEKVMIWVSPAVILAGLSFLIYRRRTRKLSSAKEAI